MAKAVPKLPAPRTVTRMIVASALYTTAPQPQDDAALRYANDDLCRAAVVAVAIPPANDQRGAARREAHFCSDDTIAANLGGRVRSHVSGSFAVVEGAGIDGVVGKPTSKIVECVRNGLRRIVKVQRRKSGHTSERKWRWSFVAHFRATVS